MAGMLGRDLGVVADTVTGLDTQSGLTGVSSGLAGSDSAGAAGRAGERVEAAVQTVSARVRAMVRQVDAVTVPCDDNDQTNTGPVNLQLDYWVHGIPEGDGIAYFESVSKAFADKGWSPQRDIRGGQRIVRGYTTNGYALIAHLNVNGELSLTSSSPCFPKTNDHSTTPQPSVIQHP